MGSVTQWIKDLAHGEKRDEATRALFDRYFHTVIRYTSRRLLRMGGEGCVVDGEDAAIVALTKVFEGIEGGQLEIASRGHFLAVLQWKALRLLINELDKHGVEPVGDLAPWDEEPRNGPGNACSGTRGARNRGRAVWRPRDGHGSVCPDILFEAEEACRDLLNRLDEVQRRIALLKLLDYTHRQIADEMGQWSDTKVERYVRTIRDKLAPFVPGRFPKAGPHGTPDIGVVVANNVGDTTVILHGLVGRS